MQQKLKQVLQALLRKFQRFLEEMTNVSVVTKEVTEGAGTLYEATGRIASIAEIVSESTEGVSNDAKVQEEMMEEMLQKVNDLSVLSKELKESLGVFKTEKDI